MITGILAPMPEEIDLIIHNMEVESVYESGRRKFYKGIFRGKHCVAALSRMGKVASSVTASVMIEHFKIGRLIVTGVAGGIASYLKPGDIVVADECVQHDLDARPMFPQFEAPLLGMGFFKCDAALVETAMKSSHDFLKNDLHKQISEEDIKEFSLQSPAVYKGQLTCGDQFIGSVAQLNKIRTDLPHVLCVEMEGGAVGQVCYEYGVPYVVLRSISDKSDDGASIDFAKYIRNVAKYYTLGIAGKMVEML